MKSKKSESSTIAPQQSTINTELYRIYDEIAEPTGDQLVNQGIISSITDAARALIAERLGNDGIPAIASRLNSGQVANNLIHAITKILDNYDVRCEDALGIFPFLFEQIGNYGPEPRDNHLEELFELRVYSWFRRKVEEETSSLEPPDRLAEVEKRFYRVRNSTTEISHACYYAVLLDIKIDLEVEIAIDSKRIENASHLKLRNEPAENSEPKKVVKTRRRDIPANLVGLFFYYLFEATASTGTREDKAKVVSKLTLFAESTVKGMLSNHLANEDKDGFDNDFKVVMSMFKLIGYSSANELMRRDKKRE